MFAERGRNFWSIGVIWVAVSEGDLLRNEQVSISDRTGKIVSQY